MPKRLNGVAEHNHGGTRGGGPDVYPNRLGVPTVEQLEDVDDPEIGEIVYVRPTGAHPEGRWRYTTSGWRSGSSNPRLTLDISQREVGGGGTERLITRFTLPNPPTDGVGTRLAVWQVLAARAEGTDEEVTVEVRVEGDVVASDDADDISLLQDLPGTPVAFTGSEGDTVEVYVINDGGGQREVLGFATVSVEYEITE